MNIEFKDIENALSGLTERIQKIAGMENIPAKQKELSAQEALAADPNFWNDPNAGHARLGKAQIRHYLACGALH